MGPKTAQKNLLMSRFTSRTPPSQDHVETCIRATVTQKVSPKPLRVAVRHTYDAVRADLLAGGGLGGGLLRGEAEDGMGLGYDGQVDGLRREMGGDGVGDADAGGALAGVDRLVFSQLKPTFSPGRAGGGRGVL